MVAGYLMIAFLQMYIPPLHVNASPDGRPSPSFPIFNFRWEERREGLGMRL